MDYKEEFARLIEANKLEDARFLLEKHQAYANEDPFYYANMGWILNHIEAYAEAELTIRKGLRYFPEDGWMLSQLGFALDRQGELEDGLRVLLKALELGFDEPWLHGEIGWCYKEKQDYANAINYFENALLDEPDNVWFLAQAAEAYQLQGALTTAEEYLVKSYRLHPDEDSLFDLVKFYRSVKAYEKEIEMLEKITNPQYQDWKEFEYGVALTQLTDYEGGLLHLLKALEYGRDDTGIRTQLGDCLRSLQRVQEADVHYNKALEYFEKALEKESETYWIYQEMIWIAHKQHDPYKKLAYLDRAIQEKPEDVWLMYHYARAYSDIDDHEHAIEACAFCIRHGEDGKEMQDLYAWNLGRAHQEKKAIEVLQERIARFSADDWNYGELGWNYAQLRDYKEACRCFKKAYDMNPKNPLHSSMLGWCYLRQEQYDISLSYLKEAERLGREDGWLHSVMGEVYAGLQRNKDAIYHYQYAIDHGFDEEWMHEELTHLKQEEYKNGLVQH